MKKIGIVLGMLIAMTTRTQILHAQNEWKRNAAPAETYISGGGWTLEQSGAAE